MRHVRRARDHWLAVVLAFALAAAAGLSCKKAEFDLVVDGGDSGKRDGARDVPGDATTPRICPADVPAKSKGKAESCTCDRECQSGFCVEGVCCTTACTENCMACNLPSSLGDCAAVPAGARSTDSSACLASTPATCGLDGTCDGKGGCRKHVRGTECKAGSCDGDSVTGIRTCDGDGNCSGIKSQQCPPYTCDPATSKCSSKCSSDTQCSYGHQCLANSCGKSTNGADCDGPGACLSGFCVDGVCCNIACSGDCVSCKETGSVGHCTYIATGLPDPASCHAEDRTSCGQTGMCDGSGHCSLYPADTVCGPSSCSALLENTPRTCDGQGSCQDSHIIDCAPFLCSNGVCETSCDPKGTDVCESGHACVSGSNGGVCGKRKNGQACQGADDCESGQCVDGVCCETSCTGACRSCNLVGSPGRCLSVGVGAVDPHKTCKDLGTGACSTNGLCDGQGACLSYSSGTTCGNDRCESNIYYPQPTCNAAGQCSESRTRPCEPYVCNGSACFSSCTTSAQCSDGNVCVNGSCGLKPPGTDCGQGTECRSGFCAQGVCCDSACDDACKACNLTATAGTCTAVTNGVPDPQGKCAATASSTCGTTGTCQNGACALWAQGLRCGQASCPTNAPSQVTPPALCDGKGACKPSTNQSCGGFACADGACKVTCTSATEAQDCVSPATCVNGSCGLKANGAACSAASQCQSGFCTEGVCCNSACSDATSGGLCKTCKATPTSAAGTCSNVAVGAADPKSRCVASNAASGDCTNSGVCDGTGKCQAWPAATGCRKESCASGSHTLAATCDGKGACPAAKVVSCNPYVCSATTCLNTCNADTDCTSGLKCISHSCGKGPGDPCAASTECVSGLVCSAQGVCCDKACSGNCESCKLTLGTCLNLPKDNPPRVSGGCPAAAQGLCGNNGTCDGAGGCETRDTCTVAASCSDKHTEVTTVGLCSTDGKCGSQKRTCDDGYLCAGTACAKSCTAANASTVCDTGYSCISGACVKKPDGATCAGDAECTNQHCVGKICCATATCPAGYSCAGGTCTNTCTATADCPTGYFCASDNICKTGLDIGQTCTANTDCTSTNCVDHVCCSTKCDDCESCNLTGSVGTCSPVPAGTGDGNCTVACSGGSLRACDGHGACKQTGCNPGYGCASATACAEGCSSNANCAGGFYCSGGSCVATKTLGATCGANAECDVASGQTAGHCVDGVCCSVPTCGTCSACNIVPNGTCAAVPAGAGTQGCSANCVVGVKQEFGCDGAGACRTTPATCPGGYMCGANNRCATSCGVDIDCDSVNGYVCSGGSCSTLDAGP